MGAKARFVAYAAAFEKAYENDDWSALEPFFHADAVYEVGLGPPFGGRFEGRDEILAYFRRILNGFDRRFATRTLELLEGPEEEGDRVWLRGRASYTAPGLPDVALELEEIVEFDGDRIRTLEDRYAPEVEKTVQAWLAEHGEALGIER